jgi:spermidine/putrescine transport system substrate-binding protein
MEVTDMQHQSRKGVDEVRRRNGGYRFVGTGKRTARIVPLVALICGSLGGVIAGTTGASATSAGSLHIYAWAGEVPQPMVNAFEKATGISVTVDFATSNETMMAKIAAGNSGFDVLEPSQGVIQQMVKEGLIVKIDHSKLVGLSNEGKPYQSPVYDRGDHYTIPWLTGGTGLLYNSKCTGTVDNWSVLWNKKYTGKLYMLDNELSDYIPALQINGYSANMTPASDTKAEIAKATKSLLAQKPLLAGYNSTNYAQLVESGQACAAEAYSGGATAKAVVDNPDVHYILPKEGGTIWIDSFSLVKGAKNVSQAYKWFNFALQPKNAAAGAISAEEATTNEAAYKYIPKSQLDNTAIYASLSEVAKADVVLDPGKLLTYFNAGYLQVEAG